MADQFEFLSPDDKPALLAIDSGDLRAHAETVLLEADYKVHIAADHADFETRFLQAQYNVVVIEETFGGSREANKTLDSVQSMPMMQRRHATFILIGESFQSLHSMQAFKQSVHAVVNPAELMNLSSIILKTVTENDLFMHTYRDVLLKMSQGS